MTYFEVVGAHLAVQFLLITAQKAVMLLIFYVCFDNPFVGSLSLVIALLFCIEAVGVAYGKIISLILYSLWIYGFLLLEFDSPELLLQDSYWQKCFPRTDS